jgi:lipoprotein-releasing system permease protein
VISQFIANRLNLKVGDAFNTFFMKEKGYNLRNFNIVGIFNSGFQEFDATFYRRHSSHAAYQWTQIK